MPWYGSHGFLNDFIIESRCRRILEVGVYNGDNAVSMVEAALLAHSPVDVEFYGVDFFRNYPLDLVESKLRGLGCMVQLFKGDSVEVLPMVVDGLPLMDVVFIDGGKSYHVASSDWRCVSALMHTGTGVFVHNVGYNGVSRMVDEISTRDYSVEVFREPGEGQVAFVQKKASSV